jgi:small nuclear ribonucleoprotein (snRNP)-like protein
VRRQKLRGKGGEISLPTSETKDSLKETLKAKILNGEICVGEMIVPKKYANLVLNKNNEIQAVAFTVQGRKIPLDYY